MITRILSSTAGGLSVTVSLLFVMQNLIASGEDAITTATSRIPVDWVYISRERVVEPETPVIKKIDRPAPVPDTKTPKWTDPAGKGPGIPTPEPAPPTGNPDSYKIAFGDGPLVNIFKVYPNYPAIAAQRGLEGTVTVQYDVTSTGAVVNVTVIESSNKIFNKSAIDAAYRFKYKPRVVDGVPYGATGFRNLFRFEMEK